MHIDELFQGEGDFPASRAMHHDGGNLTILHLVEGDRGNYECVASNAVANAITTTLLLIESMLAVARRIHYTDISQYNVRCITDIATITE